MQDSRAAVVFGEDPQTGGGGANVVPHRGFFTNILPEVFTKMPHNQDMRIGWRQSVRFGVNNGKLIDDTGVIADHVVRPRPDDLLPNRTTFSQMQFITWKLGVEGRTDGRKYMTFLTEPDLRGDLEIGAPVEFGYKMSWFDKLELFDSDNNMIGKTTTQLSKTPKTGTLTSSASATNAGAAKYSIVGYSMGNKIFTTYRHIRFTPRKSDYLTISANTTEVWDFSTNKYAALYNTGSPEEQGWNLRDGAMVIHDGVSYLDETDSGITFFCNFEEGTKPTVHIKAEFDTELNNDFLLALVYADGMKPHKLFIGSGKGIVDHAFNLKNYVGKSGVELELRFLSDPEVTGGTVKISHVKFEGTGKATRGKAVRTRNGRRRPKKQIE